MSFDISFDEQTNEIKIYDKDTVEWFRKTPQINNSSSISCEKLLDNIQEDIIVLSPNSNGDDFFIKYVCDKFLELNKIGGRYEIIGRSLSNSLPYLNSIFKDIFKETYQKENKKIINLLSYKNNELQRNIILTIFSENEEIYVLIKETSKTDDYSGGVAKKLETAHEDKNILLKEVHHRVKNNLQILNSFLSLEERFHRNETNKIIMNTKNRLKSLSLMHENAYAGDKVNYIKMEDYLGEVDMKLFDTYNHVSNKIKFVVDSTNETSLPLDLVTPLTLIINELTMNSIRYAFPENQENKEIKKSLKIENKICEFTYKDNGQGLPECFDPKSAISLGWTIVKALTDQLDGEFETFNDNGMCFKLTFPVKVHYKRA
ncbi:MAG: sensor histidine kinase [archaeon]|nr:sensor histidine kinase [archaeon]